MSNELIQRLRDQRKRTVEIEGVTFYYNRPTAEQFARFYSASATNAQVCIQCVTGWSGVTERRIMGGGSDTPVPYSAAIKAEWFIDDEDIWVPLADAILGSYDEHRREIEDRVKNSERG